MTPTASVLCYNPISSSSHTCCTSLSTAASSISLLSLNPCRSTGARRMDNRLPDRVAPSGLHSSLGRLSPELLALVVEHLTDSGGRDLHVPSLLALRLVSRRLDDIVTPLFYRRLAINEALLHPDTRQRCPRILANVRRFTTHVVVRSNLDPEATRHVISLVRRLLSVRWIHIHDNSGRPQLLPSDVLDPAQLRAHGTQLHVQRLPMRDYTLGRAVEYDSAVLPEFLTSLAATSSAPHLTTDPKMLKNLLLRCPSLRRLQYADRGQGTRFVFQGGDRLPALTHLALESYDWTHPPAEVARHWNLASLRSLKLRSVPVYNFLSSVRPHDLGGLRTLHVDDFSAHHRGDRTRDATEGLSILVRDHVRTLQELCITCHVLLLDPDAILAHSKTLRVLRLQDHVGFGDESRVCPSLSAANLYALAAHLDQLRVLEIDMDVRESDEVLRVLRAVCRFPRLHTLILRTQTVLRPYADSITNDDELDEQPQRDHQRAMRIFASLVRLRSEVCPESPHWRSITVNVGGWQPGMVRRLSESWQSFHDQGIFAERCWVLDRPLQGGECGDYVVRECTTDEESWPPSW